MSFISIIACLLIFSGAVIMAVNIFKFIKLFHIFKNFAVKEYRRLFIFYRIHQLLMLFFFVGYLVVLSAMIFQIQIVSEIFVSVIFFFGAIFVLLGIILQSRMMISISANFQQRLSMSKALDDERASLFTANQQLKDEMEQRRIAEKEKDKLEEQLHRAQKLEAIGTLAGGVAHDLNNVLSGIVGYPDLLLLQLPPDSELRKPILSIQDTGHKAAAIVQDLLTLARRGGAAFEVMNLDAVIFEYLKSLEYKKLKSFYPEIEIETCVEAGLLNILGSRVHISKVIMNLVSNSAEAIGEIGKISISLKNQYIDQPIGDYENVEEGDYVTLTVSDTGIGMSSMDMERIFEPFYTKKKMGKSGTGLGMAVVWGTVKDHKGYIDVQSSEGKGSTFKLYFPVTRQEPAKNKVGLSIEDYMGRGQTVLVVDDAKEQRQLASAMLTSLGYSVETVSSGELAIEYLQKKQADLLILDMIMAPGLDGLDTCRQIFKLYPAQKTIIASGYSETDRVKEAQRLGAGKYLRKPYTLENIGLAVKDALEK